MAYWNSWNPWNNDLRDGGRYLFTDTMNTNNANFDKNSEYNRYCVAYLASQ